MKLKDFEWMIGDINTDLGWKYKKITNLAKFIKFFFMKIKVFI